MQHPGRLAVALATATVLTASIAGCSGGPAQAPTVIVAAPEASPTEEVSTPSAETTPSVTPTPETTQNPEAEYSAEVMEQNAESADSFLGRPVEERMVLVSALMAQIENNLSLGWMYIDPDYDRELHEMNPLLAASADNTDLDIVRQYKFMENMATIASDLGAEDETDYSLETAQKISGALTVSTLQEGNDGQIADITDRVTNYVNQQSGPMRLHYPIEMDNDWPGYNTGENKKLEGPDGKTYTARSIAWKSTVEGIGVNKYDFALVQYKDFEGNDAQIWVPMDGTIRRVG